jgi:ribosomal protein S27AE
VRHLSTSIPSGFFKGDALAYARQNPDAPRCGNNVKKAARFCNKCGSSALVVGGDAHLAKNGWDRMRTSAGIVRKHYILIRARLYLMAFGNGSPACLPERIQVVQLRRLIEKGLNIEIGTVALLIEAGKIEVLESGSTNQKHFCGN